MAYSTIKSGSGHTFRESRSFNCAFNSPRKFRSTQSTSKGFLGNSSFSGKLDQRVLFSLKHENFICDPIVSLFFFCRPTAIPRFVSLIVFYTIKSVITFWSFSHISKKFAEITPSIADRDSSFSIMLKSWTRWLSTAKDHILPRTISWCSFSIGCMSVKSFITVFIHMDSLCLV